MLHWVNRFNIFCFLDNADYSVYPQQFEFLLGAGCRELYSWEDLDKLSTDLAARSSWAFGHLSYNLKNKIHGFHTSKTDPVGFPDCSFFIPEVFISLKASHLEIHGDDPENIYQEIESQIISDNSQAPVHLKSRLDREAYLQKIRELQQHILRGDCYEINFCLELFAEEVKADPLSLFEDLTGLSPNPFSALYRLNDRYLICASPERFLWKKGSRILSQPMKGTIKRDRENEKHDGELKRALMESAKDRSENVMVVDLVRNDLSQVCREGTVKVEELFGVYTYPQVHQMISTISGELKPGITLCELFSATFPMGSMTGAPKYRVMELIDQYEEWARGIFSGSVGYISPEGDFDFNVVIRSLMYNTATGYLSCQVGSGITFYSSPELEWEECMLKAEAMRRILKGKLKS